MRRARPLPLAALGAVLALAAGCGDDTEDVSTEELISRGDELCREGQERFAEVQEDTPANADQAREQTEELVEIASEELDELRRMRPPEDVRDRYERYLEAREEALGQLERGRDAAADGDSRGYAEAQTELADGRGERAKLARAAGFRTCSARGR
jgi:hypothetical protein